MQIDWKRIHDEFGVEFTQIQWDRNGSCYLWPKSADLEPTETVWVNASHPCHYPSVFWLHHQCPGEWDKTIITFPGHYEDDQGDLSDLEALSAKLHKQAADGKESAKRAKKADKAIAAIGEFIAGNGKLLSEAGIVATFKAEG